jgi:hypothetical protein
MSFSRPVLQSRHVDMPGFQNRQAAFNIRSLKGKKFEVV